MAWFDLISQARLFLFLFYWPAVERLAYARGTPVENHWRNVINNCKDWTPNEHKAKYIGKLIA